MLVKKILVLLLVLFSISSIGYCAPITSPFGWRIHPITGERRFHAGLDIGYDYNTPIAAMTDGQIVYSAKWGGYGNCVIIKHSNGDHTLYAHCNKLVASVGQYVSKGDLIAYVGSTGVSTGPHLHIEWWHNGQYTDPLGLWR